MNFTFRRPTFDRTTLLFYVIFFGMIAGEGALVGGILVASKYWLHMSWFGPWLAWILFAVGGAILAQFELKATRKDKELHDPILRFYCWLLRRFGVIGFLIDSIGFGPLATAIALKRSDNELQESIVRFYHWLRRRTFLVNRTPFGSLVTAIASKMTSHRYQVVFSVISAVIFATAWVPLFVFVWR